jgi:glycine/D-amino acid oxidase-like deaminating enzyme
MDFANKSWWLKSIAHEIVPNTALIAQEKKDVAIVGGGFTGLSTAIHLKKLKPQLQVAVLESQICGYGASGRNAGFSMTLFGMTKNINILRFGNEKARRAHQYMQESVRYLHEFISQSHLPCDYENSGYLLVATNRAQEKRLRHDFAIAGKWGLDDVAEWDRAKLRAEFNSDFYHLGWFEKNCGLLNPARFCRELKRLAEELGVKVYENSPVISVAKKADGLYQVKTGEGEICAEYLVMATNAYTIAFPQLRSLQTPIFTYIALSEPLTASQLASINWQCRAGVEDARNLIHYYRLTPDNRILIGGGDVVITYGQNLHKDENERVARHLQQHIIQVFPSLQGLKFSLSWGGPVSVTCDLAPAMGYIGKDRHALYSLGCTGHGVSMALNNGRTLAELICGEETLRTKVFFINRTIVPWPPEPLRYVVSRGILGYMHLEDKLWWE